MLRRIDPAAAHLDPQYKSVLMKAVEANVDRSVKNLVRKHKQRKHPSKKNVAAVGEFANSRPEECDSSAIHNRKYEDN